MGRPSNLGKHRASSATGSANNVRDIRAQRQSRRKFLIKAGGAIAAGAFGAVPLRGWAADPVNIGALYPTTGGMAQIGVGCVAAAKLAVDMVNDAPEPGLVSTTVVRKPVTQSVRFQASVLVCFGV